MRQVFYLCENLKTQSKLSRDGVSKKVMHYIWWVPRDKVKVFCQSMDMTALHQEICQMSIFPHSLHKLWSSKDQCENTPVFTSWIWYIEECPKYPSETFNQSTDK